MGFVVYGLLIQGLGFGLRTLRRRPQNSGFVWIAVKGLKLSYHNGYI